MIAFLQSTVMGLQHTSSLRTATLFSFPLFTGFNCGYLIYFHASRSLTSLSSDDRDIRKLWIILYISTIPHSNDCAGSAVVTWCISEASREALQMTRPHVAQELVARRYSRPLLKSTSLDMEYLRKIMEFALGTNGIVQKIKLNQDVKHSNGKRCTLKVGGGLWLCVRFRFLIRIYAQTRTRYPPLDMLLCIFYNDDSKAKVPNKDTWKIKTRRACIFILLQLRKYEA
ncbi:hypothetical protein M8C21_005941, partial [Ambrosia artemisiifolia]